MDVFDHRPKLLEINSKEILIDGEPFPYILRAPIRIDADPDGGHVVYLPLMVQRVVVS